MKWFEDDPNKTWWDYVPSFEYLCILAFFFGVVLWMEYPWLMPLY